MLDKYCCNDIPQVPGRLITHRQIPYGGQTSILEGKMEAWFALFVY